MFISVHHLCLNLSLNLCSTLNTIHSLGYNLWLFHIITMPRLSKIHWIKDNPRQQEIHTQNDIETRGSTKVIISSPIYDAPREVIFIIAWK